MSINEYTLEDLLDEKKISMGTLHTLAREINKDKKSKKIAGQQILGIDKYQKKLGNRSQLANIIWLEWNHKDHRQYLAKLVGSVFSDETPSN